MSWSDIIANDQIKNAQLLLQNDRNSIASRVGGEKNEILSFKPVDEEMLKEYNAQFPKSFEYTDLSTNVWTFRKYVPVGDIPTLEPLPTVASGELEVVYDKNGLQQIDNEINNQLLIRRNEEGNIDRLRIAVRNLETNINLGNISSVIGARRKTTLENEIRKSKL